ncbi:hypothetical protein GOM44_03685, partial [Wolbachia endosymbiont of Atemnus politus]|uniref:reverse transcriptase domain-containing protein n=1 Tax=Wolbachia endosymbiont of Atemnus politus TaxID=2682840 RepID=UPI0019E0B061
GLLASKEHQLPIIYGLPKIHKENIPIRPIVAYTNSPLYTLSKWLSNILSPIQKFLNHVTTSSTDALEKIKQISISSETLMVSYDVEALYTSIPHQVAIEALKSFMTEHPQVNFPIPPSAIISLVELCLTHSYINYNNNFFQQIKGLPMGSPISCLLANLVMDKLDHFISYQAHLKIKLWLRYVDDIFCITESQPQTILEILNNHTNYLKFTMEIEQNSVLPFLDIELKRFPNQISTSIHRKITSSNNYLNFNSSGPIHHKSTVVHTLTKRCFTHCSSNVSLKSELEKVKGDLKRNGYPSNFIQRHTYRDRPIASKPQSLSTCYLPYCKNIEQIARILKRKNINIIYTNSPNLRTVLRHEKTKSVIPKEYNRNIIYKIPCKNCNRPYVGETKQLLCERINQHKSGYRHSRPSSLLVQHAIDFDHPPDWENSSILSHNIKNKQARLVLEAWLSPNDCLNRHIDLPEIYDAFR